MVGLRGRGERGWGGEPPVEMLPSSMEGFLEKDPPSQSVGGQSTTEDAKQRSQSVLGTCDLLLWRTS